MALLRSVVLSFLCCVAVVGWAKKPVLSGITFELSKPDGILAVDEEVTWTISVTAQAKGPLNYRLMQSGFTELATGVLAFKDGKASLSSSLKEPGSLQLEVSYDDLSSWRTKRVGCGVLVAPADIKPSAPEPDDFMTFWKAQLALQDKVPMNPRIVKETPEKPFVANVTTWQVQLDTVNNQTLRGRLAKPTATGKYPAMVRYQWAGVYPLSPYWSAGDAAKGWLVFNVYAHDEPFDRDKAFYANLSKTTLKGYTAIDSESRETSYFHRMILATSRAVDYLAAHPEWNGKILLASGTSQGGLQAIAATALNPKITHLATLVPAGGDHAAYQAKRATGWPGWLRFAKTRAAKFNAAQYYDIVNFGRYVKVPSLIGLGLMDTASRPDGIMAMTNLMPTKPTTVIMPHRAHSGPFPPFDEKKKALMKELGGK